MTLSKNAWSKRCRVTAAPASRAACLAPDVAYGPIDAPFDLASADMSEAPGGAKHFAKCLRKHLLSSRNLAGVRFADASKASQALFKVSSCLFKAGPICHGILRLPHSA